MQIIAKARNDSQLFVYHSALSYLPMPSRIEDVVRYASAHVDALGSALCARGSSRDLPAMVSRRALARFQRTRRDELGDRKRRRPALSAHGASESIRRRPLRFLYHL